MMEYAQRKKTGTAVKSAAGTAREPIRQPGRAAYTHTAPAIDLDAQLRERFRERFGKITDGVRILRDPALAPAGETACARGDEIHIADGVRQDSDFGARVLEHEFGHIVQQRMGLANGGGPLYDGALERSAEHMPPTDAAPLQAELAPVQMFPGPFSQYKPSKLSWFPCFRTPTDNFFGALSPNMERYDSIFTQQQDNLAKIDQRAASNDAFRQLGIMRMTLLTSFDEDELNETGKLHSFSADIQKQQQSQAAMLCQIPAYRKEINRQRQRFANLQRVDKMFGPHDFEKQLDELDGIERALVEFQSEQFYGAAYETTFNQLRDDIQRRYEELFTRSIHLGLPFPCPKSLNQEAAARTRQTWDDILTGRSQIVIDANEAQPNPRKPVSADNQMFATRSPDYRKNPWLAGQGFHRQAITNLGRLLRTPTGEELLHGFTTIPSIPSTKPPDGFSPEEWARLEHLVVIKAAAPKKNAQGALSVKPSNCPLQPKIVQKEQTKGSAVIMQDHDSNETALPAFIPKGGYPDKNSSSSSSDAPKSSTNAGMGAVVRIPSAERDRERMFISSEGTPLLTSQPVIMGHELIHASHYRDGLSPHHCPAPEVEAKYTNPEEYVTITGCVPPSVRDLLPREKAEEFSTSAGRVNETKLCKDFGLSIRDYHNAEMVFGQRRNKG